LAKKIITALLCVVCVCCLFMAWRFIKRSGVMKDYPALEYLKREEAEQRPIYRRLTKEEKGVYTALYRGISEGKDVIPLPMEVDGNTYSRVYCILEKQESEFFYLDSVYYTAQKVRDAKIVYKNINVLDTKKNELVGAVDAALKGTKDIVGEENIVRYLNDYIVKKCRYVTGDEKKFASTAYGCLVEGEANCEGYAKAFSLLAKKLGMESIVVTGTTDKGENHAWNQVKVNNEWFNIDVTWADTDIEGEMRQMYFLCSDEDFSKTHYADDSLFSPFPCTSNKWNYYINGDLFADSYEKAGEIVRRELKNGNGTIEIRFASPELYKKFREEFITEENIFEILDETGYEYGEEVTLSLKENEQELCLTMLFT